MKYEIFLSQIRECVQKKAGEEVQIRIAHIVKNNMQSKDGMTILRRGETTSPAIYLDSYYEAFCRGVSLDEIALEILDSCEENRRNPCFDIEFYKDYAKVKPRLICKLVNYDKNREMLKKMPFRRFLDLAVIYGYLLEEEAFRDAVIFVKNQHREIWGVQEEELYRTAMENTPKLMPSQLLDLQTLLAGIEGRESLGIDETSGAPRIYVLSNCQKYLGASAILYPAALKDIAEQIGEEYFVLPSSVHECMILPDSQVLSPWTLQEIVREINESYVQPEDVLGESIYQYAGDGRLKIVLQG
ncbi:MAG TPA: hypothetical protein IAB31_09730 [Candidatus Choladousia intestinavium]|uniref:Uncharacterized protein n=1 Tax=Candidatus Choladousia intestinavium TaxID=2840727 RepID=A0A9D1DAY3_9FIRM|nr:hypothetical protein [Candidatus Choladousia intestinavium]